MTTSTPERMTVARLRAYPSRAQEQRLLAAFAALGQVRDLVVDLHRDARAAGVRPPPSHVMMSDLAAMRRVDPTLQAASAVAVQQAVRWADDECHRAWGRGDGWPRTGVPVRWIRLAHTSVTRPVGEGRYGRVQVARIGRIRVRLHQAVPEEVTTMVVTLDRSGRWHIAWTGAPQLHAVPDPRPTRLVGIDLGVTHLAHIVAWDPTTDEAQRWVIDRAKASQPDLAGLDAIIARRVPGSAGHRAAVRRWQSAVDRLSSTRRNTERSIAAGLLEDAASVALEDLNVRGMRGGPVRTVALAEAGMSSFAAGLVSSARTRSWTDVVRVPAAGTTSTCSLCGTPRGKIALDVRTWQCDVCGERLHRDYNAAVNVLLRSMPEAGSRPDLETRRRLAAMAGSGDLP